MRDRRASVPVVGDMLLAGVAVLAAVALVLLAVGIVEDLDAGPSVSETEARLLVGSDAGDGATVRLTHVAGEPITVSEIEVVVDATGACGKRARVVDLPADRSTYLDPGNVEGDPIVSTADPPAAGYDLGVLADREFAPGESFELALENCAITPGDRITVSVIHAPSSSVVLRTDVTAASG